MLKHHPIDSRTDCAYIAMFLPSLEVGGAERVTVSLANAMARLGLRVDMVVIQRKGAFISLLHPDIRIVDLSAKRIRASVMPLHRYLKINKPDVIFAHMYPLTSIAVLANYAAGRPSSVAVIEHTNRESANDLSRGRNNCLERWLIKHTYPYAARRIAVSNGAADALESFAGLKTGSIEVVSNAVEIIEGSSLEAAEAEAIWPLGSECPRLISVGSLKSAKNYSYLLETIAYLTARKPVQLLLIGEGDERNSLEQQALALGIQNSVVFAGRKTNPAPFLRSADVFVLSSKVEGLPTVLIEALAVGLSIVSTDCKSGPKEILCPEGEKPYGRLAPLDDIRTFAAEIFTAICEPADPERQRDRAQIYSPDAIAEVYLKHPMLAASCTSKLDNLPNRTEAVGRWSPHADRD